MSLEDILTEKIEELEVIQAELQAVIKDNIDILDEDYMMEVVQAKNNIVLCVVELKKAIKILKSLE